MGEVFLARQLSTGAEVAVKRILPEKLGNPLFRRLFQNEIMIASMLSHENVASILDFSISPSLCYFTMEYVDGLSALELLDKHTPRSGMPFGLSLAIALQAAKGLAHIHQAKDHFGQPIRIVHRDISPENVMLSADGTAKIIDFGVARALSMRDPSENETVGKAPFMSPEQIRGLPVDARADIYSFGAMLYQLVCGIAPFGRETIEGTLEAVLDGDFLPPSVMRRDCPPELEAIILRAMARDPEDRFQSMEDVSRALKAFVRRARLSVCKGLIAKAVRARCPKARAARPEITRVTSVSALAERGRGYHLSDKAVCKIKAWSRSELGAQLVMPAWHAESRV
jgi:serine/threonine-protein kinase